MQDRAYELPRTPNWRSSQKTHSRQLDEYALTETKKSFSSPRPPVAAHRWEQPANGGTLVAGRSCVNVGGLPSGGPCLPAEDSRAVAIPLQPRPAGGFVC
jgi:hypothetical protein